MDKTKKFVYDQISKKLTKNKATIIYLTNEEKHYCFVSPKELQQFFL